MKPINEIIIEAEVRHVSNTTAAPTKLFLGQLEFAALTAYLLEHHGICIAKPCLLRHQFRGMKIYQVDDTSYIYCAP